MSSGSAVIRRRAGGKAGVGICRAPLAAELDTAVIKSEGVECRGEQLPTPVSTRENSLPTSSLLRARDLRSVHHISDRDAVACAEKKTAKKVVQGEQQREGKQIRKDFGAASLHRHASSPQELFAESLLNEDREHENQQSEEHHVARRIATWSSRARIQSQNQLRGEQYASG